MKKTVIYLITLVSLMITSLGAMAQGGLAPFVNSTHTYTVTPQSISNTLAWSVSPGSGYTINSGAATASVNIKWTTAGTYTLTFTETAGLCSTVKTATVIVGLNSFDVTTSAPTATCNNASGQANYTGPSATTAIAFTISMATGVTTFNPIWGFNFSLTPSSGATIAGLATSSGTLAGSGPYTVTAIPAGTNGVKTVTISMNVTGAMITAQTVDLLITGATETTYNTPAKSTGTWVAVTQTINAVPNTSSITAN